MTDLILVDEHDNPIGKEEKLKAHQEGKLHRCFSIFIYNDKGEIMLQKRAKTKYHCVGLWTNTTCGHPVPGEDTAEAAHRRLNEEMNFDCDLKEVFSFIYKAKLDHGLTEHEVDHTFIGLYNDEPKLNPEEAEDWKWIKPEELITDIKKHPEKYTYWMQIALKRIIKESLIKPK